MAEPTPLQQTIAHVVMFCPLPSLDEVPVPDVRLLVCAIADAIEARFNVTEAKEYE